VYNIIHSTRVNIYSSKIFKNKRKLVPVFIFLQLIVHYFFSQDFEFLSSYTRSLFTHTHTHTHLFFLITQSYSFGLLIVQYFSYTSLHSVFTFRHPPVPMQLVRIRKFHSCGRSFESNSSRVHGMA
jgi:hypothetical protein